MPFEVDQHHSQKAKKDLHKAKVEFTLGEKESPTSRKGFAQSESGIHTSKKGFAQGKKSRSVYFFSCTLSLGLAVSSVLAV